LCADWTANKQLFHFNQRRTSGIFENVEGMYCNPVSFTTFGFIRILQFEDNEVGYVTGKVVAHATSTIPTLEPISSSSSAVSEQHVGDLKQRTLGVRPAVTLPHSTMIGELKLTALKSRLASIGVQAELIGEGVLICGAAARHSSTAETLEESVAVRKTAKGKVELEGNVSDVYYAVRREIYNLHALVAA
jgi:cleavage and polyadenylation specificity factor subunit 2